MALSRGTRVGPYEVVSPLGVGGMGEVYKARDTRLNRTVALKVLPAHIAADPQTRQRFEREARSVGALNHPHICTLHDIGRVELSSGETIDYLVMEYLEGETLATRLENGALPLDQAVATAIQIAAALDRAHRAGIVHRDVKPGNIMFTKGGAKLLDFGIATAPEPAGADAVTTERPGRNLSDGLILGTGQYMSPEQIEGRAVDARTDLFAFGAVLYEMATGRKAFEGGSPAGVVAAILERQPPPLSSLQPMAPAALDRIVSACLEKDPEERWQTARDLRRQLEWLSCSDPAVVRPAGTGRRWLGAAALVAAGTLVGVGLGAGVWHAPATAPASMVLEVVPPPDTTLLTTASSIPAAQFALSADGRHLAFVAAGLDGRPALWLRALDSGAARRLAGTEGASLPFWAEDSRGLAFFASGQLKRTDLEGSSPQGICSAIDSRGGTWNREGVIVFAIGSGGLFRVNAGGGSPTPLTTPDVGRGEVSHRWPSFLPDGKHFLYTARGAQPGLLIGSLEGGPPTRINDSAFGGVVTASRLFFIRNRALMSQRFDNERLQVSGEPVVLLPRVGTSSTGQLAFAVTSDVLAYADDITSPGQLTWFDRAGRVAGTVGPVADHLDFELSPDARRVLVSRVDPERSTSDVWLVDLERATDTRLTTHPGIDAAALWDPTGSRVVFRSNREGLADAWIKNLSIGEAERLLFKGAAANPTSWSTGGVLLYNDSLPGTGWDVMQFEETRGATSPFIQTSSNELHGRFSPNGQWVAYSSDESGRWEVYVRPARGSGAPVPVSNNGGFEPRWRGDGKELFYLTPDRQVVAVDMRTSGELHLGTPRALFSARVDRWPAPLAVSNGYRKTYTVMPDGQRFLVNVLVRQQNTQAISVMLNWSARLGAVLREGGK